ncbi:MAG: hypothetical protein WC817_01480 [Patescibacteria group bacterium]|jgi:hypothetical protein
MVRNAEAAAVAVTPVNIGSVRFIYQKRRGCGGGYCLHAVTAEGLLTRCLGQMTEDEARSRIEREFVRTGGWIAKTNEKRTSLKVLVSWLKPTFEEFLAALHQMGEDPIRRAALEELAQSESIE